MSLLTLEQLRRVCPETPAARLELFVDPINRAWEEFLIDDAWWQAAFLGQVAHECGAFRWLREIWGPTPEQAGYDARAGLGNTRPKAIEIAQAHGDTPGHFWLGRGGIQTTGYDNYLALQETLGIECVETPMLLEEPMGAMRAAAHFWRARVMQRTSDPKRYTVITRGVNGLFREFRPGDLDRYGFYESACAALGLTKAEDVG
jgi:putative chitinase